MPKFISNLDRYWFAVAKRACAESWAVVFGKDHGALVITAAVSIFAAIAYAWLAGIDQGLDYVKAAVAGVLGALFVFLCLFVCKLIRVPYELQVEQQAALPSSELGLDSVYPSNPLRDPMITVAFEPNTDKIGSKAVTLNNRGGGDALDVQMETISLESGRASFDLVGAVYKGEPTKIFANISGPDGGGVSPFAVHDLNTLLEKEWMKHWLEKKEIESPIRLTYVDSPRLRRFHTTGTLVYSKYKPCPEVRDLRFGFVRLDLATTEVKKESRITSADWDYLAARFKEIPTSIRVEWQRGGMGKDGEYVMEGWWFAGGDHNKAEELGKRAGKMLLLSPKVSRLLSERAKQEREDDVRWLRFIKERHKAVKIDSSDVRLADEDNKVIVAGTIRSVAEASERACIACAAEEL